MLRRSSGSARVKLPDIHPDLTPEGRKRMHEACVKQTEDTFLRIERMGGRDIFRRPSWPLRTKSVVDVILEMGNPGDSKHTRWAAFDRKRARIISMLCGLRKLEMTASGWQPLLGHYGSEAVITANVRSPFGQLYEKVLIRGEMHVDSANTAIESGMKNLRHSLIMLRDELNGMDLSGA